MLSAAEVSALRHDLRTPVNHIVGYCELLLEDTAAEDVLRRKALQAAIASAREVIALIEGALPSSGQGVSGADVEALRTRMRPSHDRIMAAMEALHPAGTATPPDGADIAKVRRATGQLLAVDRASAAHAAPPAASSAPSMAPIGGAKGRILVVDDVEDNRGVLMRHLVKQGYEVEAAADGATALRMAAASSFDLMLLDVRMPGIDGKEVLVRIKQDAGTRDLPVVMISAADELETIAGCIEAGADDFLPKPFDPVLLRARVSASVEKKRLRDMEVDYLRQVHRVVEAAVAVEQGQYVPGGLSEVAKRDDAIGHLARVFDTMAAGVRAREERLSAQVNILKREIEEAKGGSSASVADELDAETLLPGATFGDRYTIIRVVGRGGMGTVYKAHDKELAEDIAIKLLRVDALRGDPTMVERFKSEIRLARRISHTTVVRTHDFGETAGAYYVTMEYVEGITLRDLIDLRGTLSPAATLGIARQLTQALAVAHEQGVIHRDIKPQNLLLDAAGVLKVMDFGIATLAGGTSTITQAGMVVGTPAYMAPEQLLAETVDARSDLYAVGVVLYECLTGELPHQALNNVSLIAKVLNNTPVAPVERNPEVPPPLSALVMRLLHKDASGRPQSADELGVLLAQIA
ncbi:MAG TPA: protein kinase [Gemmatimonadales bacterium]|nr:protein kinase [Gemmatimonadales bacterium]